MGVKQMPANALFRLGDTLNWDGWVDGVAAAGESLEATIKFQGPPPNLSEQSIAVTFTVNQGDRDFVVAERMHAAWVDQQPQACRLTRAVGQLRFRLDRRVAIVEILVKSTFLNGEQAVPHGYGRRLEVLKELYVYYS